MYTKMFQAFFISNSTLDTFHLIFGFLGGGFDASQPGISLGRRSRLERVLLTTELEVEIVKSILGELRNVGLPS